MTETDDITAEAEEGLLAPRTSSSTSPDPNNSRLQTHYQDFWGLDVIWRGYDRTKEDKDQTSRPELLYVFQLICIAFEQQYFQQKPLIHTIS